MKILFVASECAPFAKSGGLGDVLWSLPRALKDEDTEVAVMLPKYTQIPSKFRNQMEHVVNFTVDVSYRRQYCGVDKLEIDGITYYFIDSMYYFDRESLYGYVDDGERFSFFSQAVIEAMEKIDFIPDVLHVNDWQAAIIPLLLKVKYSWIDSYQDIRTMLTIHNLKFQGIFPREALGDLLSIGDSVMTDDGVEFYGTVNYMKGGINYADWVTTVSPTYAEEIKYPYYGEGLHGLMLRTQSKLSGILNGIDREINDPATDPHIPAHYTDEDLSGKKICKAELQKELGLPVSDAPIIGIISRLTDQKGFDILSWGLEQLLQNDVQFVVVGTGELQYEEMFRYFAWKYPDKISSQIRFDAGLAQRVYAGSDMMLVPSRFEPCGLTQLVAMRYGTVPVVRETGGLKDTVTPYNPVTGKGLGFTFQTYDGLDLKGAVDRALEVYHDPTAWQALVERDMAADFSWDQSADKYRAIYENITGME